MKYNLLAHKYAVRLFTDDALASRIPGEELALIKRREAGRAIAEGIIEKIDLKSERQQDRTMNEYSCYIFSASELAELIAYVRLNNIVDAWSLR